MIPLLIPATLGLIGGYLAQEPVKYAKGGLIAPNGEPSNLTPEQYKLVRTPEFKAWFGDWENDPENASKVVDDNGEPLVVYHFSNVEFNVFEIKGLSDGFFFTKNIEDEEFSQKGWLKSQGLTYEQAIEKGYDLKYEKAKPYFLKIKQIFTQSNVKKSVWSTPWFENRIIEWAKKDKKNDGVEFLREIDNKQIIVAFYPNQIKLADGSNTTFDANNPDIRYKEGGKINDLILYHGSNNRKIYEKFYDYQFYTVNDYIASNYAYNFGGLMYKVKVTNLNSFELKSYHKERESDKYNEMIKLLTNIYDNSVAQNYEQRYFTPSPSYTFGKYGWNPIIEWAKKNGYDSIKFYDESFDTYVRDITYLIFDGSKPKIIGIYDVEDAVESNFSKEFKIIK